MGKIKQQPMIKYARSFFPILLVRVEVVDIRMSVTIITETHRMKGSMWQKSSWMWMSEPYWLGKVEGRNPEFKLGTNIHKKQNLWMLLDGEFHICVASWLSSINLI